LTCQRSSEDRAEDDLVVPDRRHSHLYANGVISLTYRPGGANKALTQGFPILRRDMIIIAGYELVDAQERDEYVAAHRDLVSRAREFDGCIHVAITADSVDPKRINSVEVWPDAEV